MNTFSIKCLVGAALVLGTATNGWAQGARLGQPNSVTRPQGREVRGSNNRLPQSTGVQRSVHQHQAYSGRAYRSRYNPYRLYGMSFSPFSGFDGTTWDRTRLYFGNVFEPWPLVPGDIYGWPYLPQENPTGHVIRETGPNGYTYGPVYGPDGRREVPLSQLPPVEVEPAAPVAARAPFGPQPAIAPAANNARLPAAGQTDYFGRATEQFRASDYDAALKSLRHLEVDEPDHQLGSLLRVQALMALEDYSSAAAHLRLAIENLPAAERGRIVARYRDWYASVGEYAVHLRKLKDYVSEHGRETDALLLLGYQYGYLGYRGDAVDKLGRVLAADPDDSAAQCLWQQFGGRAAPAADGPREL